MQVALLSQKFSSTPSDSPETSSGSLELSPEVRAEGKTRVTRAAGSDTLRTENSEAVNPSKEYLVFSINRKFNQMATLANTVEKRIADWTLSVEAVPVIQEKGVDAITGTRAPLGKEGEISCGEKSSEYQGQPRQGAATPQGGAAEIVRVIPRQARTRSFYPLHHNMAH